MRTPLLRAVAVAALQVALIAAVGGALLYERATLPRAWLESAGVDPELPIRGRYLLLNLLLPAAPGSTAGAEPRACGRIELRDGQAVAVLEEGMPVIPGTRSACFTRRSREPGAKWMLLQPVAFFLPENARDPTRGLRPGELWVEATLPPRGRPRPIRLGLMRGGTIQPIP